MDYSNEHQRQMAILEASIPYLTPGNRHAVEMLLQADSLVHLASHMPSQEPALEAAETANTSSYGNMQEMLLHIQQFLTPKESDIVQMVLNFMNANTLFQNYKEFAHTRQAEQQDRADLNTSSLSTPSNTMLMEFLVSRLSPEQKDNFEQLQNIMYNRGGNE